MFFKNILLFDVIYNSDYLYFHIWCRPLKINCLQKLKKFKHQRKKITACLTIVVYIYFIILELWILSNARIICVCRNRSYVRTTLNANYKNIKSCLTTLFKPKYQPNFSFGNVGRLECGCRKRRRSGSDSPKTYYVIIVRFSSCCDAFMLK